MSSQRHRTDPQRPDAASGLRFVLRPLLVVALVALTLPIAPAPASAAASLAITPITWNVAGLDSNNEATGPDTFASGARVCNTGDAAATNVVATYVWDTANTYVNLSGPSTLSVASLAAGTCTDLYFNVVIIRNDLARQTSRRYHITATADGLGTVSTPTPREIYVENLVSQNRNSINSITGPTSVFVGGTYTYVLNADTATNGYEQLSSFLNFPNTIFQILTVGSTYTTGGSNTTIYADACGWQNDPAIVATYRSCVGPTNPVYGPKAGGTVVTTYSVKILAVPGGGATGTVGLTGLVYDFSGSSYHYNSDHGAESITVSVSKAADLSITKSDSPDPVTAGNNVTYSMTVSNSGPSTAESVTVTDPLPAGTSFVSATGGGTYNAGTGNVTWSFADITSGGSTSFQLVVKVNAGRTASISNTATVASAITDPNGGNDSATQATAVSTSADLSITKSDSPDPVGAGETLTYTLNASNAGPSDAQSVVVTDTLPADVTSGSATPSQGSCSRSGVTVTCNLGTLAASGSATVTITVTPTAAAGVAGSVSNTASVSSSTSDPSNANNSATQGTTVQPRADVRISKTDSVDPVVAGNTVTYSMTVTNDGPSSAANVAVTDPLPAGTFFVSATGGGTESGGTVTWNLGTMASGVSTTVQLVVRVHAGRTADISNTATVSTTTTDPTSGNNAATQGTTVATSADLSITKSDSPDPVGVGSTLTYTLTASNAGPSDAQSVVVADILPANVTFGSATPSQGSCSLAAGVVTCDLGTLGASGSATVTITVTPTATAGVAGSVSNAASVSSSTSDPSNANNSATQDTTVQPRADLSITKSDSPTTVVAGQDVTYTITVSNAGPSAAAGVTVTDAIPTGTSYVSASPSQGSCSVAAGTLTCGLGGIASGANATIMLVVSVDPSWTSDLSNTATVTSTTTDPAPGNDSATEATTVSTSAGLSLTKTDSADPVAVGQSFSYTLAVANAGPSDAAGVVVTDTLPADVTFGSATPSQGSCSRSGVTVTCTLGAVAASGGASVTITVTPIAAAGVAGSVSNTASVSSSTPDPSSGDDSDTESTAVTPVADLGLSVDDFTDSVTAGTSSTYDVVLSNGGPSTVPAGVVIEVPIPSGTAASSADPDCAVGPLVLTCTTAAPIASGDTVTFQVTLDVAPGYLLATLQVTGTITSSPYADTNGTNDTDSDTDTVDSVADASVAVSDGRASVTAGDGVGYAATYTVSNAGPSTAQNVVLDGTWPVELTRGALPAGCLDVGGGPDFTCSIGDLAPGASASVDVPYTVPSSAAPGTVTFGASVSAGNDANGANDAASDGTDIVRSADLSLTKTDSADPVAVGQSFSYTLAVANAGPSDAAGVVVTDTLPADVTFGSATPTQGSCSRSGVTVTCTLGAVAASGGASVTITVTPTAAAGVAGSVSNTASVSSSTPDPSSGDDSDTESTAVTPVADLSITKTGTPDPVVAGETVTYTITASNAGPSTAGSVVVSDQVPVGTNFVSADGGGSETGGTVTWNLGDLSSGASTVVHVTLLVHADRLSSVDNTATVDSPTPDPDPGNDSATATTGVGTSADLLVSDVDAPDPAWVGEDVTYTLTVTNGGPSDAVGVVLDDTLPAGSSFVSATPSQGTCGAPVGGVVTCAIGDLSVGASVTVDVVVTASSAGTMTDSALVGGSTPDPNAANDSASADTTVTALAADLGVSIDDGVPTVTAGTSTTYTITLTNHAGSTSPAGAAVEIAVPAGTTGSTADPDCSIVGSVMTCATSAAIAAGDSASWQITLDISPGFLPGNLDVPAAITIWTLPDPNGANDDDTDTDSVVAEADLSVAIDDLTTSVTPGTSTDYDITVTNLGPSTEPAGAVVTVVFPAGTTGSTTDPDCTIVGSLLTCTTATDVGPGHQRIWSFTLDVAPGFAGSSVDVTSQITSTPVTDPDPTNDLATDVDAIAGSADVSVSIGDTPDPADVGQSVTYALTVSNAGPSDATGVTLVDTLPVGATFGSATPSQGTCGAPVAGVLTCDLGGLAVGASATISIVVTPTAVGTATDTAQVAADQPDPVPADNDASEDTTVTDPVDLSVSVSDAPDPATLGQDVTYTVTVSNNGPMDATGVTLVDTLPAGATFASATPSQGTCGAPVAGTLACDLGDLAVGASATVTIVVTPTAVGTATDTAQVAADQPDPVPGNDASSASTSVLVPAASADLSIVKTDAPDPVTVGQALTYSLAVSNAGPDTATAVVVSDTLPSSLTFGSATASQGSCSAVGNAVTCTIGDLASGANATVTIVATPTGAGAITNTATVQSAAADPDPADNSSSQGTTVNLSADVSVTKTVTPTTLAVAGSATFTLTVSNAGPSAASAVQVTDPLPAGLAFVSAVASQGTCAESGGTVTCDLGALASGASATVTVVATATVAGVATNIARVTAAEPDPDPADNSASVAATVTGAADVSISKTASPDPVVAGNDLTYTLTVRNDGSTDAVNVVVSDPLPPATTFVSADHGGTLALGTVTWALGTLPAGSSVTLTLVVAVGAAFTGDLSNTAAVASDTPDLDASDATATAGVTVDPAGTPVADLSVKKTVDETNPANGSKVTYTVVVSNAGPADATGLVVEDILPNGLEYVSSSCTQGTYAAADGKWKVGNLAVGETATMTMTARVTGKGGDVIDNVAEVVKLDQDDPDGANDRAARDVEVLGAVATVDDPSTLAFTGGAVVRLFLLMLAFTALGILILLLARRFRDEDGSPS